MSDGFGDAVEYLAVVQLQRHIDTQVAEHPFHYLDEFEFTQQAPCPDDVHVALVELPVAPLLRPVGTPYRLYLIAPERECYFGLVLNHIAGEGNRQVVTEPLFAYPRGHGIERCAARLRSRRDDLRIVRRESAGEIARIQDFEQQLVALFAVLARQGGEVLHGRGFERGVSVGAEYPSDGVEHVGAAHHLQRREVARPFRNGRFLCHDVTP